MEKQMMIKHPYSDKTFKIKNIIRYLELFVDSSNDKIVFNYFDKKIMIFNGGKIMAPGMKTHSDSSFDESKEISILKMLLESKNSIKTLVLC